MNVHFADSSDNPPNEGNRVRAEETGKSSRVNLINFMKRIFLSVLNGALACALCACTLTTPRTAGLHGPATSTLDPREVAEVSEAMVRSILASNVLKHRDSSGRAIVLIESFRNKSYLYTFDPNILYNRLRSTFNRSGVAHAYLADDEPLTNAFLKRHRAGVDANNAQIKARNELLEFTGSPQLEDLRSAGHSPQYSLTVELQEDQGHSGHRAQAPNRIHMVLSHVEDGLVVWEDVRELSKR